VTDEGEDQPAGGTTLASADGRSDMESPEPGGPGMTFAFTAIVAPPTPFARVLRSRGGGSDLSRLELFSGRGWQRAGLVDGDHAPLLRPSSWRRGHASSRRASRAVLTGPRVSVAQQAARLPRIGALMHGQPATPEQIASSPLRQGLKELGWIPGQNVIIEALYSEGNADRLVGLAEELGPRPSDSSIRPGAGRRSHQVRVRTSWRERE
jgi:hypothetical protein